MNRSYIFKLSQRSSKEKLLISLFPLFLFTYFFIFEFSFNHIVSPPVPNKFNVTLAYSHVAFLSKLGPRSYLHENTSLAINYINQEFQRYGLKVKLQNYSLDSRIVRNKQGVNIIALKDSGKPMIIYCAHYDSVPESPGANDNAAGVGVLLELAHVFSKYEGSYDLAFIAFGDEEYGKMGSRFYTHHPLVNLSRVVVVLNLENLGIGDRLHYNYHAAERRIPLWLAGALEISNQQDKVAFYPITLLTSDHDSFAEVGIPTTGLYATYEEEFPYLHTSEDSLDKIDPKIL